jgi:hypothetical protein
MICCYIIDIHVFIQLMRYKIRLREHETYITMPKLRVLAQPPTLPPPLLVLVGAVLPFGGAAPCA